MLSNLVNLPTNHVAHSRIFQPGLCYFTDCDPVSCDRDIQSCEAAKSGKSTTRCTCNEGTKFDDKRGEPKSLRPEYKSPTSSRKRWMPRLSKCVVLFSNFCRFSFTYIRYGKTRKKECVSLAAQGTDAFVLCFKFVVSRLKRRARSHLFIYFSVIFTYTDLFIFIKFWS